MRRKLVALMCLAAIAAVIGCSGTSMPNTGPDASALAKAGASGGKIQHIVVIVQENRTFDNFFDCFKGTDCVKTAPGSGARPGLYTSASPCPVLNTPTPGPSPTPIKVKFHQPLVVFDPGHTYCPSFKTEYDNGQMDGFSYVDGLPPDVKKNYVIRVTDPSEIKPYWAMAQQYVLGDRMFPTEFSASYTAHQTLIRGDATYQTGESLIDLPNDGPLNYWGCDAPAGTTTPLLNTTQQYTVGGPFPCMTYETVRDTLEAKGVSWRYYAPIFPTQGGQMWNAFDGISAVRYSNEWPNGGKSRKPFTCPSTANCVSWPNTNVFCDISGTVGTKVCPTPNPSGNVELPAVSWVIPTGEESDHYNPVSSKSGKIIDTGPDWVSSVVNAVGESKYWNSTAIIITWDDWGGFWDHVSPPQMDYRGLGFRVPLIIVSPYAKKGYVSHTQYEFGSILKFMETTFGLASLNTTDLRANNLTDAFDFSRKPRAFVPIPSQTTGHDRKYFMALPPSHSAPDSE
ncbi:MAG TPA: alkaline phosphatase family protein [Candidatus Tumulicola sp.]